MCTKEKRTRLWRKRIESISRTAFCMPPWSGRTVRPRRHKHLSHLPKTEHGGRKLAPQEIRTAVYRGPFIDMLKELNGNHAWRAVFGAENDRMKDRELILRFFAMLENSQAYKKPMVEFFTAI